MPKKELSILLGILALKFLLQFLLIDSIYELQRDEYLHLDQANHLALGYTSVPPFTSWISLVNKLLGNSVFWVKFFPALFGALTLVLVWNTVSALHGHLYAKILASCCVLFSALLRLNTLFQPNSMDVLAWTATYFFLIKYIQSEQRKWILYTAIAFGIGFLNKYNIIFLALGVFPALLLTQKRNILLKADFYFSLVIALLIVSPNIYWQIQNDFPVFHHLQLLSKTQLVNVSRTLFLKNQLLFFTGSIPLIASALYGLLFSEAMKPYRFLFWSFLFTLLIFTYFKAKDYYAIGLYPIYVGIGAAYLSKLQFADRRKPLLLVLIIPPLAFFFFMYTVAFPNQTPEYILSHQEIYKKFGMLRWEDGKDHEIPQDYADMLGWKELAMKTEEALASIQNPERTLILCDNYGQAGAINYYSNNKVKAVSFEADYINWFDLDRKYSHLIRIKNRTEKERELAISSPYFEFSEGRDSVTNKYSREFGTTIFVFKNSKIDINQRIIKEIESSKKK